jgi:hypothetical protein
MVSPEEVEVLRFGYGEGGGEYGLGLTVLRESVEGSGDLDEHTDARPEYKE